MTDYNYDVRITRVVDGDTVDVDIDLGFGVWLHKERVRIMGIDTPESRTSDDVEKVFGKAAKRRMESLLPVDSMQVLMCEQYDSKGKFGRILGDFKVEGDKTVTEIMIEEGHCVPYFGGSKEEIQAKHMFNRQKLLREGVVSSDDVNIAMRKSMA